MQIGRWKCLSHNFDTNERWKAKKLPTIYGWLFFEWQMVCVVGTFGAGNEYINRLLTLIFFFLSSSFVLRLWPPYDRPYHPVICFICAHVLISNGFLWIKYEYCWMVWMDMYSSSNSYHNQLRVRHFPMSINFHCFAHRLHLCEWVSWSERARARWGVNAIDKCIPFESLNTWVSNVSMEM